MCGRQDLAVTIKDVALRAGVSIATVSHVINRTRYVSPDLVERVEMVIKETGYEAKVADREYQLRVGKLSEIAFVFPYIESTTYNHMGNIMSNLFALRGYSLAAYPTSDDPQREKTILTGLLSDKRVAGIVLVPSVQRPQKYKKLINSGMPLVCLERTIDSPQVSSVLSENIDALYKGTVHLIKNGHEKIAILINDKDVITPSERLEGYKRALKEFDLQYDSRLAFRWDLTIDVKNRIRDMLMAEQSPTAFLAASNFLTLELLKIVTELGIEYPKDISIVGFGDDEWCGVVNPPLTTLTQNPNGMAEVAAEILLGKIERVATENKTVRFPVNLTIRKSTRSIERGPNGETAISVEQLMLTDAEIELLRAGNYKIGISFHYSGTEWTRLHERAIRETLAKYGVKVVAVAEAHFDPELQITQLQGLRMQKLDAVISMPADETKTADAYKKLSKETKLIMIGNIPNGLATKDYCALVSVNERENGQNAGRILGDFFRDRENVKVGLITHGASFFTTKQRDRAAEQVLMENYRNIEVVSRESFYRIENAYEVCRRMLSEFPGIEGLYVSWEYPAREVIRALEELGRTDISIATVDLDYEIALHMAHGEMVRGLSAQKPYEQGEAAALATARALLGNTDFVYVGVQPQIVTSLNLRRAWMDIMHTGEPNFLKQIRTM